MRDRELIAALLGGAAVLTACGGQREEPNETASAAAAAEANDVEPAPSPAPSPTPAPAPAPAPGEPGTTLPPADAEFRYVGRWAVDARSCDALAWRWSERKLETPGHTVCDFETVTPVPGGYDIVARCTAEAPPADDRIKLRFAESAKAMLVEAKSFAPVGLVYCGLIG